MSDGVTFGNLTDLGWTGKRRVSSHNKIHRYRCKCGRLTDREASDVQRQAKRGGRPSCSQTCSFALRSGSPPVYYAGMRIGRTELVEGIPTRHGWWQGRCLDCGEARPVFAAMLRRSVTAGYAGRCRACANARMAWWVPGDSRLYSIWQRLQREKRTSASTFKAFVKRYGRPGPEKGVSRWTLVATRWVPALPPGRLYAWNGKKQCITAWAREAGLLVETLRLRLGRGEKMPYALRAVKRAI